MLLEHTTDIYDGVTIDGASLPATTEEFTSVLEASLEAWRSTGKKGVWLKVRAGGLAFPTVGAAMELAIPLAHAT